MLQKKLNKRSCQWCGEEFQKVSPLQRFCGPICGSRYLYDKQFNKPRKPIKKVSQKMSAQKKVYQVVRK